MNKAMLKKFISLLLTLNVFVISGLTYYRATLDEADDELKALLDNSTMLLFVQFLALSAGLNEAVDVWDHLVADEVEGTQTAKNRATPILMSVVLAPFMAACAYAHVLQGQELAEAVHQHFEIEAPVTVTTTLLALPALSKFLCISLPHLWHALDGSREAYTLAVTHNRLQTAVHGLPSLKWWGMLAIVAGLHYPEGRLIAGPIEQETIKSLAVIGFALAESIPHVNHLEQVKHNLLRLSQYSGMQWMVAAVCGIGAGTVHASETVLAVLAGGAHVEEVISPVFEFGVGFLESTQHLTPHLLQGMHKFGLMRSLPQAPVEENNHQIARRKPAGRRREVYDENCLDAGITTRSGLELRRR